MDANLSFYSEQRQSRKAEDMSRPAAAKVVVIGDPSVGKTSLRSRWLDGTFTHQYKTTIGADFYSKTLDTNLLGTPQISLAVWDTAGAERFRSLGAAFYRGSDAVVIVFSIIDKQSLKNVASWYAEFKARAPVDEGQEDSMTWVCVANKLDLANSSEEGSCVTEEEAQSLLDDLLPPSDGQQTPTGSDLPPDLPEQVSKPPHYSTNEALHHNEQHPLSSINLPAPSEAQASIYHTPDQSLASSEFDGAAGPAPTTTIDVDGHVLDEDPRPLSPLPPLLESSNSSTRTAMGTRPHRGIKLFFTSAKSGENVAEPFQYIAEQIALRMQLQHHAADQEEAKGFVLDNVRGGGSTAVKVGRDPGAIQKGWQCC